MFKIGTIIYYAVCYILKFNHLLLSVYKNMEQLLNQVPNIAILVAKREGDLLAKVEPFTVFALCSKFALFSHIYSLVAI